jgi:GxxExxY protein
MNDIFKNSDSENIGVYQCSSVVDSCSENIGQYGSVVKDELTDKIIACVFTVSNTLGSGFLEKVYHNALAHELSKNGLKIEREKEYKVHYDGIVAGEYYADIVVEARVVLELKAVQSLDQNHFAQCINYLKASKLKTCLLINFGTPKVQIKRISN